MPCLLAKDGQRRYDGDGLDQRVELSSFQQALCEYFGRRPEVAAALLFGSRARGEARPQSDVDLAVLLTPEAASTGVSRSQMLAELMNLAPPQLRVDLAFLNDASPLLQHRVLRDGIVLFVRDNRALARFTIRAMQRYEDTRRLRRLQHEWLRQKVGLVPGDRPQEASAP